MTLPDHGLYMHLEVAWAGQGVTGAQKTWDAGCAQSASMRPKTAWMTRHYTERAGRAPAWLF